MSFNVVISQLGAFDILPSCVSYVAALLLIHSTNQQQSFKSSIARWHRQTSAATDPLSIITRTVKLSSAKSISQHTTSDTTMAISDSSCQYWRSERVLLAKQ